MSWCIGGVLFLPNDIHHTQCPSSIHVQVLIHWSENMQIMTTVLSSNYFRHLLVQSNPEAVNTLTMNSPQRDEPCLKAKDVPPVCR